MKKVKVKEVWDDRDLPADIDLACPYRADIHGDYTPCHDCTDEQRYNCAMDV